MISTTNRQIMNQIASTYGKGDAFEKGQVSNALNGYGGDTIKFTKTGKEIREKIPSILEALNTKKSEFVTELTVLRTKIGCDPDEVMGDSAVRRYSWNMCRSEVKCDSENSQAVDTNVDANAKAALCDKYNNIVWQLCDVQSDIDALGVMASNLKDGDKYSLTTSQLVAMHFK